jgi:hypothetical protein
MSGVLTAGYVSPSSDCLFFLANKAWWGAARPGDRRSAANLHGGVLDGAVKSIPRNDEPMTAKVVDLVILDLDVQLKEYKRRYEQAKTELRRFKGGFLSCSHIHSILNINSVICRRRSSYSYKP